MRLPLNIPNNATHAKYTFCENEKPIYSITTEKYEDEQDIPNNCTRLTVTFMNNLDIISIETCKKTKCATIKWKNSKKITEMCEDIECKECRYSCTSKRIYY